MLTSDAFIDKKEIGHHFNAEKGVHVEKKKLYMTRRKQEVMDLLVSLLTQKNRHEKPRIRGIRAAIQEKRPDMSNSLVSGVIETLQIANILVPHEIGVVAGQNFPSVLYEWHQEVRDTYEIVTANQPRNSRERRVAVPKELRQQAKIKGICEWHEEAKKELEVARKQEKLWAARRAKLEQGIAQFNESVEGIKKLSARQAALQVIESA